MNLTVQNQVDLTSAIVKGMNRLKTKEIINFDYYSIKSFSLGGQEIMLADEVCEMIIDLASTVKKKLDILFISDIKDENTDYYFYLKGINFTEEFFSTLVHKKPLYHSLLKFESHWGRKGVSVRTFNVHNESDACLLISFDSKVRTM